MFHLILIVVGIVCEGVAVFIEPARPRLVPAGLAFFMASFLPL